MNAARFKLAAIITRLEAALLRILTPSRSLPCDSHPRLCKCCHGLRHYLKYGELPPRLIIATNHGAYDCSWRRRHE